MSQLIQIIVLIAQALDLNTMQASDVREVQVTWYSRPEMVSYLVKVGDSITGWTVEREQEV